MGELLGLMRDTAGGLVTLTGLVMMSAHGRRVLVESIAREASRDER